MGHVTFNMSHKDNNLELNVLAENIRTSFLTCFILLSLVDKEEIHFILSSCNSKSSLKTKETSLDNISQH